MWEAEINRQLEEILAAEPPQPVALGYGRGISQEEGWKVKVRSGLQETKQCNQARRVWATKSSGYIRQTSGKPLLLKTRHRVCLLDNTGCTRRHRENSFSHATWDV